MKDKIEGYSGLYKDSETGVIVNRENSDRERYRLAKANARAQLDQKEELNNLKDEISEIKSLLQQLTKAIT